MSRNKESVFAVVLADKSVPSASSWPNRVTGKEAVTTQKVVEKEIARLTKLLEGKDRKYFWQAARLVAGIE